MALVYGLTCFGLPGSTVSGRHEVSSLSSLFIISGDRHLSHSSRVSNVRIADRSSAPAGVLIEGTANFHNVQAHVDRIAVIWVSGRHSSGCGNA